VLGTNTPLAGTLKRETKCSKIGGKIRIGSSRENPMGGELAGSRILSKNCQGWFVPQKKKQRSGRKKRLGISRGTTSKGAVGKPIGGR